MLKPKLKLKRRATAKAAYSRKEYPVANFIPYLHHYNDETIITKDGELVQFIKVDGFSFETSDDEDLDMKKMVRNSLLKSMADGTLAIWFHIIRRRKSAFPGGEFAPGFARAVNDKWKQKHHSMDSYVNELYITVVRKADTEGAAKLAHYFNKISDSTNKSSKTESMREAHKELTDVSHRILASFRDYGARQLSIYERDGGVFSEPLEFLSKIVNCGVSQPIQVTPGDISHNLMMQRLYFGRDAIEIRGLTKKRYAAMISIKEYSNATAAGIMDAFLQLPHEFIVSQSFVFTNRQTSISNMQLRQRRMIQSNDAGVSQVIEISDALDMAQSGHAAFGRHHLTIMCLEESLERLDDAVSMATSELINVGINPIREKMIMEQCFWAQLPANFSFVGRKAEINTLNLSGFASLHNYPTGRMANNHWGDAVTVFDTSSGTPYFFNFHLRDVGHTTIIGPTGAGKTVLMNFLCAQAQKFRCRLFFFDKDRGAEIFIRALGGNYNIIEPGERCNFNPLQLPDTMENRNFIGEWLKVMVTVNDEPFTAEDMEKITDAVVGNYKLDPKDRILRNIAPFLGMEAPGTIASRLKMWHTDGQYAQLFDNLNDTVDFSDAAVFGFEMGPVLNNKATLAPVLLYLFHKINLSLDGTPTIVVLDEAWALIDNPIFASRIKDWLKTLRKLNAMVIFATQSVEDATNSSISDTLVQQTATQIFLPNPKATDVYRKAFMLSEREFNLLKSTDPGSRFFLVKQGKDVVVARIDLSGMDDIISVLSGRAETVGILDEVLNEYGDDPAIWLPIFQQRVREL
ncbi:MAG TPA: VirB4 family type IV secretion/conjugal transfer ATPase [Rickettsiales bacterium]|nr:VirB4 family type IV secretion/conjugal transfer ATPase [Rickettsiales bacterium]